MVGRGFELSKENVETVSMDSTSWPCNDGDECLDSPHVCGNGNHRGCIPPVCVEWLTLEICDHGNMKIQ